MGNQRDAIWQLVTVAGTVIVTVAAVLSIIDFNVSNVPTEDTLISTLHIHTACSTLHGNDNLTCSSITELLLKKSIKKSGRKSAKKSALELNRRLLNHYPLHILLTNSLESAVGTQIFGNYLNTASIV